ncbi:MAG: hypothetical protein PHW00_00470 [Clostridia bacterium]|nr:hypothetical protein [Clostridia bacterium]
MQHYRQRFADIFNYTSRKWWYVILKTICIVVGLPLYIVLIPLDLIVFAIYVIFSWIPFVGSIFLIACRILTTLCSVGYYVAICVDAPMYINRQKNVNTVQGEGQQTQAQPVGSTDESDSASSEDSL